MKRLLLLTLAIGLISTSQARAADNPVVVVDTSQGAITIELFPQKARGSVEQFLKFVDNKFYDGTVFHSVLPNARIEAGLFDQNMKQKPTPPPSECEPYNGVSNERGTVAMALLGGMDESVITSPFFINVVDSKNLDNNENAVGSPVIGKVTKGMDVVDKIKNVKTTTKGNMKNVPARVVLIKSIRRAGK